MPKPHLQNCRLCRSVRRLRPLLRPLSSGERRSSERALSELLSDTMSYTGSTCPESLKSAEKAEIETGTRRGVQGPTQPQLVELLVGAKQERAAPFTQIGPSQEMDS